MKDKTGIWRFILGIILAIAAAIGTIFASGSFIGTAAKDIVEIKKANSEQDNCIRDLQAETRLNRENVIRIQSDLSYIKDAQKRQEGKLDKILDRIK
jgi:TATA-box binding protein (TBP) (component of TFIID and TFIIIB)